MNEIRQARKRAEQAERRGEQITWRTGLWATALPEHMKFWRPEDEQQHAANWRRLTRRERHKIRREAKGE